MPDDDEIISEFERTETERVEMTPIVERLLEEREEARIAKQWARADKIRDELSKMGVEVEDGADGVTWKLSD